MTQSPFQLTLFVPFHLADPAGILFFGHAFTLAHQAFEQFVTQRLKLSWEEWFRHPDWIVPIKAADAIYESPIRAGSPCNFALSVESVGESSLTVKTTLSQNKPGCLVKTVHVFCDAKTHQKMSIPSHILSGLKAAEQL